MQAIGISTSISNYTFTHLSPTVGFNFYKIKQIDVDGRFTYSEIVKVLYSNSVKETFIAPNPVVNVINIVQAKATFIKSVEVYDSKAALMLTKKINAKVQVYSLPVLDLPKGQYILKVYSSNNTQSFKVLKL